MKQLLLQRWAMLEDGFICPNIYQKWGIKYT
jgi:hypothetical protein